MARRPWSNFRSDTAEPPKLVWDSVLAWRMRRRMGGQAVAADNAAVNAAYESLRTMLSGSPGRQIVIVKWSPPDSIEDAPTRSAA